MYSHQLLMNDDCFSFERWTSPSPPQCIFIQLSVCWIALYIVIEHSNPSPLQYTDVHTLYIDTLLYYTLTEYLTPIVPQPGAAAMGGKGGGDRPSNVSRRGRRPPPPKCSSMIII